MENLYIMQGSYKIEIVNEFLSISEVTGSLLRPEIECSTIHVGIGRNIYPLITAYTAIFSPSSGSRIFGTFYMFMESPYLPRLPKSTYIEKDTSFLWNNNPTAGSRPDNLRI